MRRRDTGNESRTVRFGPKRAKSVTFSDFAEPKCREVWSKSPGEFPFMAYLTHFGAKSDTTALERCDVTQVLTVITYLQYKGGTVSKI